MPGLHSSMKQATERVRPLAITMGDAAGIGPEIIAKAFAAGAASADVITVQGIASMTR